MCVCGFFVYSSSQMRYACLISLTNGYWVGSAEKHLSDAYITGGRDNLSHMFVVRDKFEIRFVLLLND